MYVNYSRLNTYEHCEEYQVYAQETMTGFIIKLCKLLNQSDFLLIIYSMLVVHILCNLIDIGAPRP